MNDPRSFVSVPSDFISEEVRVSLVGCGGNGSSMLLNLARLNHALLELGHPGLSVSVFDGDVVSASNVGRQCFFGPDIGRSKSEILVNRVNLAYGTEWIGHSRHFGRVFDGHGDDLIIVAVDSANSRKTVHERLLKDGHSCVIVDLGNGSNFGQVLMGGFDGLPSPYVQAPSLIDEKSEDPTVPSCSMAEALRSQELFVNSMGVTLASQLLWELFRYGKTNKAGFYFNLESGKTVPVSVESVTKEFPVEVSLEK